MTNPIKTLRPPSSVRHRLLCTKVMRIELMGIGFLDSHSLVCSIILVFHFLCTSIA